MRQGQHSKKNRGRNRRPSNPGNRVYESNGPDVKIRGNASHVSEKYLALARDAQVVGDPIASENYLQHAEHYLRIIAATQAHQQTQNQPCSPDQGERPQEDGRDNGAPQSRGRGRSNGAARRDDAAEAPAQDGDRQDIAAGEDAAAAPADTVETDTVKGSEPDREDEAATVEAVSEEQTSDAG